MESRPFKSPPPPYVSAVLVFALLGCADGGIVPSDPSPASVAVWGPDSVAQRDSIDLSVVVRDENGKPLDLPVTWSSSDTAIASIENGTVRGRIEGAVTITAHVEGLSDTHGVTVEYSPPVPPEGPQTVVLFATPKMISDFDDPEGDVAAFLSHYEALVSRASETIVIFAVGNSEHILQYRGRRGWDDPISWAWYTGFRENPISGRPLDYHQVAAIVRAFRSHAETMGLQLSVFDQIDQGREFANTAFKDQRHPECLDRAFEDAFDIRARMSADHHEYATAPGGIAEGTLCGHFLADQVSAYLHDLHFDGILYGNQLGTRGHWLPENGPGYSEDEAVAIRDFMEYTQHVLGSKSLMWFDSYNAIEVERDTFSFPSDGYSNFDYLIAAGFAVITFPERYVENLESKLTLGSPPRILATLDYVDPWYFYNSMIAFPGESARLEEIAIDYKHQIDGLVFFANDEVGNLVPPHLIESFATRFFGER